jgi:hypothetical protein
MCGKKYMYCYRHSREWGSKSIIWLHRNNLLNCFVPHRFLSNFQGKKFEKVKLNGIRVLLLNNYINDQLVLEKKS